MSYQSKVLGLILLASGSAAGQGYEEPVRLLLKSNREIQAAKQAHQAAREAIKMFGTLPDPMIESSLFLDLEPIQTRNGPMEGMAMVGQKFPLWGKLKRERAVAHLKAETAALNLKSKEVSTVFQMRQAWETYVKSRRSLDILEQYREELETFRTIALTQYATGTGVTQHPILKLQIEISLIDSRINGFESRLESAVNELQSLYDGGFSPELFGESRTSTIELDSIEVWTDLARQVHPGYGMALTDLDIARFENQLAVRMNFPDLVAGFTYTVVGPTELPGSVESGSDAYGFRIGLNLPIWFKRNRARILSTELAVKSREEQVEQVWNEVEKDLKSNHKDLAEIEQTYLLYSDKLVQESEQMVSSAFSAYETGKISFLDLLDSERMVVGVRLDFEKVEADRRIASARLLKSAGVISLIED